MTVVAAAAGPGTWEIPWLVAAAAGVALLLAAAGAVLLLRWTTRRRRRRHPRREIRLKYPVVLAHGLMGFDEVVIAGSRHEYFRGVKARLDRTGNTVVRPTVPKTAAIAVRARELARCIEAMEARRVNVVAHSMGGLDARFAIAHLGLGERVASLVTVGTPHRGTPLADLGTDLAAKLGISTALRVLGIEVEAFWDLTTRHMEEFNGEVPDLSSVEYLSVVATVGRSSLPQNPLLIPTFLYLKDRWGENDGLVPASSQRWGDVVAEVTADHLAQIGWSRHFDAADVYEGILRELRGRGF